MNINIHMNILNINNRDTWAYEYERQCRNRYINKFTHAHICVYNCLSALVPVSNNQTERMHFFWGYLISGEGDCHFPSHRWMENHVPWKTGRKKWVYRLVFHTRPFLGHFHHDLAKNLLVNVLLGRRAKVVQFPGWGSTVRNVYWRVGVRR